MRQPLLRSAFGLALCAALVLAPGCVMHDVAESADFNGHTSASGRQLSHVNTTSFAIHLLGSRPLIGNATFDHTMQEHSKKVGETGATHQRVVQSGVSKWWFIFGPFSIIFTPVWTNVASDGEKDAG
jgi:hypothetical protein